ncbi:MAG: hypothetical protein ASARMPREDX12_004078 [Alectoria sarmentosa]|nr:MAG: hypothetical protein ASARMPREDX12_004078 [Alectoria sarmentosa]
MGLPITRTGPAKFPLNRMPVELVHMICGYLSPTEVASIRIMSSTVAAVGLEYIATTITLTLEEDSFDRLLEIAHHPIISQHVHSLHYEHDFLTKLDRAEWEETIKTPELMAAENASLFGARAPRLDTSERGWRAICRETAALKAFHTYGKKRLDKAFLTYQEHCAEQEHAQRSDFFSNKLTNALQHLPNLRTIYMPMHGSYSRYQKEIAKLLQGAFYDQFCIQSESVAVTRSLLLAVDQAMHSGQNTNSPAASVGRETNSEGSNQSVLPIKSFNSESFNWRLFLEDDEVFTVMKRSISNLTKLGIRLLNGSWIKYPGSDSPLRFTRNLEASRECLARRRLYEFVKSAPCLEEVNVSLCLNNQYSNIHLKDVVESFHWQSLKTVHFQRIKIDVGSLGEFCSRHSSTLSNLALGDLQMPPTGSIHAGIGPWYTVFTEIREATKLKEARVYGVFDIWERASWIMDYPADVWRASGTLIGRYLVGEGGNSSLEDFLDEEYLRLSEQEGKSSASKIDDDSNEIFPTSENQDLSSESDA